MAGVVDRERVVAMRRAALVYTLGRVGFFLLVALLVFVVTGFLGHQVNGLPLLLIALLVSSVGSLWLLRDKRDQLAQALAESREAKTAQIAARRARLENDA
jgi:uncharacterized integral membrane protein